MRALNRKQAIAELQAWSAVNAPVRVVVRFGAIDADIQARITSVTDRWVRLTVGTSAGDLAFQLAEDCVFGVRRPQERKGEHQRFRLGITVATPAKRGQPPTAVTLWWLP
jgi:hypothetical protein